MLGVVQLVDPLDNKVPPVEALYQSIVSPAAAVADNIILPVPQFVAPVPVGIDGNGLMVAITAVRVDEGHPLDDSAQYVVVTEILGVV